MVKRSILGKEYDFKEMKIDIFKLKYYPENPRVHHVISILGQNPSQDKIEEAMWNDNTKDLFWDIRKKGLQDPILISEDYYVMEGNSRLCAFRHLYYQAKEKNLQEEMDKWRYIQCEIYPPGIGKLGLHYMLGTWHIKQKNPWDAFEKASYIRRIMTEFHKTVEQIAEELHIKKTEINKMLWIEEFMKNEKIQDIKKYSYLEPIYQKPELRKKVEKDKKFKKRIVNLIHNASIGKAENLRKLHALMEKKKDALDKLEDGVPFEKVYAEALLESPDDDPLLKDIIKITKKLDKLNMVDFLKETKSNKTNISILKHFIKSVDTFKKVCQVKKLF